MKRLLRTILSWLGFEVVPRETPLQKALMVRSSVDDHQNIPILDYHFGTQELTEMGRGQLRVAKSLAEFTMLVMEARGAKRWDPELAEEISRMWYGHEDRALWG